MRYPGFHCEFAASRADRLKSHIKNKHEGVRYPCDQCDNLLLHQIILKDTLKEDIKKLKIPVSREIFPLPQHRI